jgi:hypothetical protein
MFPDPTIGYSPLEMKVDMVYKSYTRKHQLPRCKPGKLHRRSERVFVI